MLYLLYTELSLQDISEVTGSELAQPLLVRDLITCTMTLPFYIRCTVIEKLCLLYVLGEQQEEEKSVYISYAMKRVLE